MIAQVAANVLENVNFDEGGFMVDARAWTPAIAVALAEREEIALTDRHWVVINFVRTEYETTGESPTLRRITKASGVDTKEIYQLFPGGPAKLAAKIAGLKKPTGCI
jgi:tRNA 2-thiouridine synthesizing protein E